MPLVLSKKTHEEKSKFKKIVVVKDDIIPWHDEKGILYIGIEQFLLDESAIGI